MRSRLCICLLLLGLAGIPAAVAQDSESSTGFLIGWHRSGGDLDGSSVVIQKPTEFSLLPRVEGLVFGWQARERGFVGSIRLATNSVDVGTFDARAVQCSMLLEQKAELVKGGAVPYLCWGGGPEVLWVHNGKKAFQDRETSSFEQKWWGGVSIGVGGGVELAMHGTHGVVVEAAYRVTGWGLNTDSWWKPMFISNDQSIGIVYTY